MSKAEYEERLPLLQGRLNKLSRKLASAIMGNAPRKSRSAEADFVASFQALSAEPSTFISAT